MLRRLARVALLGALLAGALTACTPEPEPTPTFPFATEAEAFAAAEATYRAYVDALNAVDLSDPATFEDVYAWTTGEFSANERQTFSEMHADGWTVTGQTELTRVTPLDVTPNAESWTIAVCVDVSDVELTDENGTSQIAPDRPDTQSVQATLVRSASTATRLAIEDVVGIDQDPPC